MALQGEPPDVKRVLIASPVRQDPRRLRCFLEALRHLDPCGREVAWCFMDDNTDAKASAMLRAWRPGRRGHLFVIIPQGLAELDYHANDDYHVWRWNLAWRVGAIRNRLLQEMVDLNCDAVLLVDSDICLRPDTLHWLLAAQKDIVSELMWTRYFQGNRTLAPNCWVWGESALSPCHPWEVASAVNQRVLDQRRRAWYRELREPGLHEVGGLGAVTLISRRAYEAGCSYSPMPRLGWWGEDRFFCVRAQARDIGLFVDNHAAPLHLYRSQDVRKWPAWRDQYLRDEVRAVAAV
ncbi:MAG: hypothetical protein ACYCT1_08395 [Steroidobacteraceae bacterium]